MYMVDCANLWPVKTHYCFVVFPIRHILICRPPAYDVTGVAHLRWKLPVMSLTPMLLDVIEMHGWWFKWSLLLEDSLSAFCIKMYLQRVVTMFSPPYLHQLKTQPYSFLRWFNKVKVVWKIRIFGPQSMFTNVSSDRCPLVLQPCSPPPLCCRCCSRGFRTDWGCVRDQECVQLISFWKHENEAGGGRRQQTTHAALTHLPAYNNTYII